MRRIILLAGIVTASFASAKTTYFKELKKDEGKGVVEKKSKVNKKRIKSNQSSSEIRCYTHYATCTAATTCQDWGVEQWLNWIHLIQENYCMYDSPFEP